MVSAFSDDAFGRKLVENAKPAILFVDDEERVLLGLKRAFRRDPYRILTATDGIRALEIMEKEDVQLVISDYDMPDMTGAQLLSEVQGRWPDTIRIMLTGAANVRRIMDSIEDGTLFKFMTKPYMAEELRITVRRALEQLQLEQQVRSLQGMQKEQQARLQSLAAVLKQERGLLAKMLLREQTISQQQCDQAFREQGLSRELMYRVLVRTQAASPMAIFKTLEKTLLLETMDPQTGKVSPDAAAILPPDYCIDNLILPISIEDETITLAMADPSDVMKRDNIEALVGMRVTAVLAQGDLLEERIRKVYGLTKAEGERPGKQTQQKVDKGQEQLPEVRSDDGSIPEISIEEADSQANLESLLASSEAGTVVSTVNAVLSEALSRKVSDIHLSPKDDHLLVQYRIDGMLQKRAKIPRKLQNAVVARIKVMAQLDIAERRLPQDGRIAVSVGKRAVDLRISCLPLLRGEKVVIRLLDRHAAIRRLRDLGLKDGTLDRLNTSARQPQGIIVCTGPTGSGKTTTLYSLLNEYLDPERSYGTIEDPVEYLLEDASQAHVRERIGLTFPVALRSMLRQDPDVILIGEMRDSETAQISFQASLTGHLVLSTLHTNDAVGSITRLLNLGVAPYIIAPALTCIIAQRLLRRLCADCARDGAPDPKVLQLLELQSDDIKTIRQPVGCDRCYGIGYAGRAGAYEILTVTDEIRELIFQSARESELTKVAREQGMCTLFEDALEKVHDGVTTIEEVLRVMGPQATSCLPCNACGHPLLHAFNACPSCGKRVRHSCPHCDAPTEDGWKHCVACGHSLQA